MEWESCEEGVWVDPRVGVVGLGPMGKALATALVAAGYEVTVWDRDTGKVAATAMIGASSGVDAAHVGASSDVVFTALPDGAAVTEVAVDGERGILAGLADGAVLADMTTAGPAVAARLDTEFTAAGRRFLDAPVSGRAPRMTVLLGAGPGEFADVENVLREVSTSFVHCGARGAGYATKLIHQQIKYGAYLASGEALLVARRFGLDPATTVEAIRRSSGAGGGFADAAAYFLGDRAEIARHGPARTIVKDMRLAAELAGDTGVEAPVLMSVAAFFERADNGEHAEQPYPMSTALLETAGAASVTGTAKAGRP